MRKMKFFSVSAALFAVGMLVTSCFYSDDPVDNTSTSTNISGLKTGDSYTLTLKSNVKAKLTVGNQTFEGTTHTFEGLTSTDVTAKAVITEDGYVTKEQEAKITFDSEKNAATVVFEFMKKSTNEVAQGTAIGGDPVTNDADNQTASVPASITVPAGTTVTGNTTDPFSVTVFQPAAEVTESDVKTLAVSCTPDGAKFDKDVTLKLKVGTEYAGMTVKVKDPANDELKSYKVSADGFVTFTVNHFSIWDVYLEMTADTKNAGSETIMDQDVTVQPGTNTFTYTKKQGYETSENLPWFVAGWMNGTFGQLMTTTTLTTSFTADTEGTVHLNIIQAYTDYGYKSGDNSTIYNIKAWGDVTVTVTPKNGSGSSATSHSGGSGK